MRELRLITTAVHIKRYDAEAALAQKRGLHDHPGRRHSALNQGSRHGSHPLPPSLPSFPVHGSGIGGGRAPGTPMPALVKVPAGRASQSLCVAGLADKWRATCLCVQRHSDYSTANTNTTNDPQREHQTKTPIASIGWLRFSALVQPRACVARYTEATELVLERHSALLEAVFGFYGSGASASGGLGDPAAWNRTGHQRGGAEGAQEHCEGTAHGVFTAAVGGAVLHRKGHTRGGNAGGPTPGGKSGRALGAAFRGIAGAELGGGGGGGGSSEVVVGGGGGGSSEVGGGGGGSGGGGLFDEAYPGCGLELRLGLRGWMALLSEAELVGKGPAAWGRQLSGRDARTAWALSRRCVVDEVCALCDGPFFLLRLVFIAPEFFGAQEPPRGCVVQ